MRLYSKHHLVAVGAICSLLTALLIGGIVLFSFSKQTKIDNAQIAELVKEYAHSETLVSGADNSVVALPVIQADSGAAANGNQFNAAISGQYTQDEIQNISVYEKYNNSVVNITTEVMAYNWFFQAVPQDGGTGSGSIITSDGYIVTNVHVIEGAYKIYVSLSDGSQYEGRVIGTDSASDIAVIKFDPPAGLNLTPIPFGDSSDLKVGQKVLAIGNPFGFERTLTSGIISGLGRPIQNSDSVIIRGMIQTDTAINPGNSGGPLLDTQGHMIGINTMIYSTSGSSAGVGFAVPINMAKRVVADLIQYGSVKRGTISGSFVELTDNIASYGRMSVRQGLLVSTLDKNSHALEAGLQAGTEAVQYGSYRNYTVIYLGGDVITAVDGVGITSFADFNSLLESKNPGDTVTLTVQRGKEVLTMPVILDEKK
ncbi:MAG: trypsin-like peptidase domain-containing protein [Treponemataceae bacterium]|nr:trypsin-like peptidase domain-containing protein [Treponemataceae bacterium]